MAKQKIALTAVIAELKWFFSERVEPDNVNGRERIATDELGRYVEVIMDTTSLTKLLELAKNEYQKFLIKHDDNNLEWFIDYQLKKANNYQSRLEKWEVDNTQKTWYAILERWKRALRYYWSISQQYSPELNAEIDEAKGYLHSQRNFTFINLSTVIDAAINQVLPIWPNVEPNKYYFDFFKYIDFIALQDNVEINEGIEVIGNMHFGFEMLQKDIEMVFEQYRGKLISLNVGQIKAQQIAIMLPLQKVQKMANNNILIKDPYASCRQITEQLKIKGKPWTFIQFRLITDVWGGALLATLLREYLQVDKMLKEIAPLLPEQKEIESKAASTEATEILSFESLFYDARNAESCLSILRKLDPPVIDIANNYIGKNKGIFPMWVVILKKESIIKHFTDKEYKDILNNKIKGLNLGDDASEFRKTYKRLEKKPLEIKALLSQLSQDRKIGK